MAYACRLAPRICRWRGFRVSRRSQRTSTSSMLPSVMRGNPEPPVLLARIHLLCLAVANLTATTILESDRQIVNARISAEASTPDLCHCCRPQCGTSGDCSYGASSGRRCFVCWESNYGNCRAWELNVRIDWVRRWSPRLPTSPRATRTAVPT